MKRAIAWTVVVAIAAVGTWQGAAAWQATQEIPAPTAPPKAQVKPAAPKGPSGPNNLKDVTPMQDRVAVLGLLNKRNGLSRDITMKPGEGIRIGDVVVRLSACETTAPWEAEQLTGAFVQVVTRAGDNKWYKIFSGWLYKESPSLNVVEHPIYDVWVKDCQMRHPDIGADTIMAREGDAPSDDKSEE